MTEDNGSFTVTREGDSTLEVHALKRNKPIRVEGITVYPTEDYYFHIVRYYGIVEELTDNEKGIFFQKHGSELPSTYVRFAHVEVRAS